VHTAGVDSFEDQVREALANPKNQGEIADADAVGTVGSPDCGDMLRMWLKFTVKDGKRVIDRASFQSFGCQTALAVASVATELLKGKTPEEAAALDAAALAGPLGALPPMKLHCGQLVEGALRNALAGGGEQPSADPAPTQGATLSDALRPKERAPFRIVPLD
jgi:nitrogen fixation NifU-like protein